MIYDIDLMVNDDMSVDLTIPENGRIIEGGYYIPSIQKNELTWNASKPSMPLVPPTSLDIARGVGVCEFKGTVAAFDNLPTNAEIGDIYDIALSGINVVWTGNRWDTFFEEKNNIATNEDIENMF